MSKSLNQSANDEEDYEAENDDNSESEIVAEPSASTQSREQANSMIELRRGEELEKSTAYFITARRQARVITMAGDVGSGKTTLLISIYERFRRGIFAGYIFAGSETLMGFERRCWRSRISSGADSPDTERTPSGSTKMLHLSLRRDAEVLGEPCDLLLFDLSGEDFREARTSTAACRRLSELKRTDHFVLLIDGAKLADSYQRHEAIYAGRQLVQRLLHAEMLSSRALVSVLFSKYDLICPHEESAEVKEFIKHIKEDFTETFGRSVANLRFFKVAARPSIPNWEIAYGIDEVLPLWIEETPFRQTIESQRPARLKLKREFDAYYERRLPHLFE